MSVRELIARKRDGGELSSDEIGKLIEAYASGRVADSQMAALLMAVALRGMTARETADLTLAMVASGERLDLSAIPGTKVDKHSTGGVGDKTTLVVAPLVAALGVPVPKMSGRALGHTGGTIDKLEAIPGLTTEMSPERFRSQVAEIGVAIAAQTDDMVPADKQIYALRDATATVDSVPLIASSVMSKKLAVGADAIVIDVKAGGGAFMPDLQSAHELARAMVDIGRRAGKQVVALITRMDDPLGTAVGDGPELIEAVQTLGGAGPADLVELCEILGGHMLSLGGAAANPDDGRERVRRGLAAGAGVAKLREMVVAQGGRGETVDNPETLTAKAQRVAVQAARDGCVAAIDARSIGLLVRDLKAEAGERKWECGVVLHKKAGDFVRGEPLATVLAPKGMDPPREWATARLRGAFRMADSAPARPDILAGIVTT